MMFSRGPANKESAMNQRPRRQSGETQEPRKKRQHRKTRNYEVPARLQGWVSMELKYPALLVALVLLFVVYPILVGIFPSNFWFDVILATATLAVGFTLLNQKNRRSLAIGLGIPAILFTLSSHAVGDTWTLAISLIGHVFLTAFLGLSVTVLLVHVVLANVSVACKITGSICGYLLLGIFFAVMASMIDQLDPKAYLMNEDLLAQFKETGGRMSLFVYYSFVTMTTLGYGDMTPISQAARTLAWFEAVAGQFYVAILVAGLVGRLGNQNSTASDVDAVSE
jgi:voltage-gated potassium channel